MPSKRTVVIGSVVALALAGAAGGALAASGTFDPQAERQAYLNDVAGRLGVTSDKLENALKAAAIDRVDAALAAGRISKDQADAMKAAINAGRLPLGVGLAPGLGFGFRPHGGLHFLGGGSLDAAATYLGLTEAQLRAQLMSGKSLADVAKAQGKSVDGLEQAMLAPIQAKLDQAVKDGKLTSSQRDQALAKIKASIDDMVNGKLPARPSGAPQGFGFGRAFGLAPHLRSAPGMGTFRGPSFRNAFPGTTTLGPAA
jgi:hypothetical protein